MAFNAQITRASLSKHTPVSVTRKPASTRPGKALIARAQPQGTGAGDVCDPPTVYNQAPAEKVVRLVDGEDGAREFDAPRIEQTIVQHEVERVKPVIHQEIHQTRLHEVTHHKRDVPRDMGITEVVQHADTDPCGNPVTQDLNAVRGSGTTSASTSNINVGAVRGTTDNTTGHKHEAHTHERPIKEGLRGALNELLPGTPFTEKV